ncbi:hypothetical protein HPB51_008358 [Rhipicephalus microplus]|uniref:Endonuclease/exonuclease/phosphatase domain-containing protein n=1 Tax=Rhipicephalus microplus TaxID=6941 RepID=A0A9J6ESN5_RHIMP|nr:hypothetical protein HPB51_008358 [Rhipicephalus microplus]
MPESLYVTGVYTSPQDQLRCYDCVIRELRICMKDHRIVVVGNFDVANQVWGYDITTKKGVRAHDSDQQHGLTLLKDVLQPTRVGKSVSRDTTPDLIFTLDVKKAGWTFLPETLGSDNHINQLEM